MADLTPDQLGALTDLSGNDLLLVWSALDSVLRKMEADVLIDLLISAAAGSYLAKANNLSDLTSASVARGNLGLGTAAVQAVGAFLQAVNNLSDIPSAGTARTNLGLGALAVLNTVGSAELAAGAAVANIGYTPLNRAGDTVQGHFGINGSLFINGGSVALTATPLGSTLASASSLTAGTCVTGSNTQTIYHRFNRLVAGSDSTGTAYEILLGVDAAFVHNLRFNSPSSGRMFSFRNENAVGDLFIIDPSGNVAATGNVTAYSDRRLKCDFAPITGALALVESLDGVRFNWIDGRGPGVGVIAQDVEEVFPELVHTDLETGIKSVAYANLVAPLIEAVKELAGRVRTLEAVVQP